MIVHPAAKRAVLLLMLLLGILPAAATVDDPADFSRNYVVKVWGPDDGLAEDSVTDIAQTPEGYLWVGTLFGSVLRFDGTHFVSYNSANTPQFSLKWGVPRLMVGREGTLWISMYDGGLTAWNKNGFHSIFTSTNRPDDLLWSAPGKVIFVYGGTHFDDGPKNQRPMELANDNASRCPATTPVLRGCRGQHLVSVRRQPDWDLGRRGFPQSRR